MNKVKYEDLVAGKKYDLFHNSKTYKDCYFISKFMNKKVAMLVPLDFPWGCNAKNLVKNRRAEEAIKSIDALIRDGDDYHLETHISYMMCLLKSNAEDFSFATIELSEHSYLIG